MPSGLASDSQDFGGPVVAADFTVTLTAPKVGQLVLPHSSCCGVLVVRDIGTPPELLESDPHLKIHWIEPAEFRALPLARDPVANKGTYGHALIVAGSLGKSGAAILAARGALRSGAGLVTVATPQDVLPIVAAGIAGNDDGSAGVHRSRDGEPSQSRLRAICGNFARQIRSRHRPGAFHAK